MYVELIFSEFGQGLDQTNIYLRREINSQDQEQAKLNGQKIDKSHFHSIIISNGMIPNIKSFIITQGT